MKTKRNITTAIVLQFVTILSGFILPKMIISEFGSQVNGLVSSITQFLSFISLLEGGIGAVVLSELYKPIEERDTEKINGILNSCKKFFFRLSVVFSIYTIVLLFVYPFIISDAKNFSFKYCSSLILILSINTLMQYMFSITYKLLLQADQRVYIINILSICTVILNLVFAIIIIKLYPSIHIVKLGASLAFVIQPVVYNLYIKKKYNYICLKTDSDYQLKSRWDGFWQNLAHYINMNTDIIIISLFLSLNDVSVYSVYMLALNAIKQIIVMVNRSYQSNMGKYIASGNESELKKHFAKFSNSIWVVSIILFSTCLLLVNPFVEIYTKGVSDVVYYSPVFAAVIVLAQFVYCVREPYRFLILSAGKFKETNFGSFMEALLNIVISLILIKPLGLAGVAIGTLVAIGYRFVYFYVFLKKEVLFIRCKQIICIIITSIIVFGINYALYISGIISVKSYISFAIIGFIIFVAESIFSILLYYLLSLFFKRGDD